MSGLARRLRAMITAGERPVTAAGAHDGLGAILAERAGYQAVWASSFEISASHGLPDAGLLGLTDFLHAARVMVSACGVPVIADCDTGFGNELNVAHTLLQYQAAGVAAICLEDKVFPKLNSFAGRRQELVAAPDFAHRITTAKAVQEDPDLIVIARTEALIAGAGVQEALDRAHRYTDAGADAILIHSKSPDPGEVVEFIDRWAGRAPVVVVPTTYFNWSIEDAHRAGVSIVIHANQGLRASISALTRTFEVILAEGSTSGVESQIATLKDVFDLQRMDDWMALEA